MTHRDLAEPRDVKVGLCSICDHASTRTGAKEIVYWCCDRASSDAAFRRYPTLPVEECAGFERGSAKAGNPSAR